MSISQKADPPGAIGLRIVAKQGGIDRTRYGVDGGNPYPVYQLMNLVHIPWPLRW
jgi:hypothetical protein